MIIVLGIMMMLGVTTCIIMGGADIGKDNLEIGKWIEEKGITIDEED